MTKKLQPQDRDLHKASAQGNAEAVLDAIRRGAHLSGLDSMHRSPLLKAAAARDSSAVKALLAQGADPWQDISGNSHVVDTRVAETLLRRGHLDVFEDIVRQGIPLDVSDPYYPHQKLLGVCAVMGHAPTVSWWSFPHALMNENEGRDIMEVWRYVLRGVVSVKKSLPVLDSLWGQHSASAHFPNQRAALVDLFVEHGLGPPRMVRRMTSIEILTPTHRMREPSRAEQAERLSRSTQPRLRKASEWVPRVVVATSAPHSSLALMMFNHLRDNPSEWGGHPENPTKNALSVMEMICMAAARKGFLSLLRSAGHVMKWSLKDMSVHRTFRLRTLLHEACSSRSDIPARLRLIKALLDAGASVNAADDFGWTPLHEMAAIATSSHMEILEELTRFGGDWSRKNHKGKSPFSLLSDKDCKAHWEIFENAARLSRRIPLSSSLPHRSRL